MSINDTVEQSPSPLSMDWSFALGGPVGHCLFKQKPEDFCVDEELPFEPEGEGEHLYLLIEKKGENTDWVAGLLAKYAGVRRQVVSYAGRKDRQGVARQWFCLSLPGQSDPDWQGFQSNTVQILKQARHRKKLRAGALKSNRFTIRLREVEAEREEVEKRLNQIFQQGVPNYYGEQRFGHEGRNVDKALAMFSNRFRVQRNKRSVYLSAARSWLFNQVVSERTDRGLWRNYLAGDVLGFWGSNSLIFDALDENLSSRLEVGDLSPTAPLWGRGLPKVSDQA
ncbi:MAG: tRNA pseudouridine(13) synthase TruD, partial [Endozoicomonas sp.]